MKMQIPVQLHAEIDCVTFVVPCELPDNARSQRLVEVYSKIGRYEDRKVAYA
jgi:hypothetical protein